MIYAGTYSAKRLAAGAEALGAVFYGVTYYPRPYEKEICAWHFFDRDGLEVATHCAGFNDDVLLPHPGGRVWGIEKPALRSLSVLKGE